MVSASSTGIGGDNSIVATTSALSASTAGSMSIVQFQLPTNQSAATAATTMVQSVIQPNHQSVIQPTNPISTIQFPKNVILVNKLAHGSVIQSTESEQSNIQMVKEENETTIYEDESKRRRENLARRPSYRKILNDLSSTVDTPVTSTNTANNSNKSSNATHTSSASQQTATTIPIESYIKMLPSIQIGSTHDGTTTIQGIPTIMTNANTTGSTIVQYATAAHDGQFIVPDLQTYQLRPPPPPQQPTNNQSAALTQNVVMTTQQLPSSHNMDEALKKREMRLLKNREAAKECRRKKKEYIKCLENRVAVLENQNKALIEELKTLKELYCKKSD
ncbi:Cyclic AMP-responsive element-binding protein 1 [Dermatophagoides pteronyssinus]|uniref:Cyclic AMP-responsive element-binding protein 1 n=1 Tax=Dermatophagoides pteronyssinus TaxID=6956 RepID=A0ABQ8J9H2_DERPT|nr:Cyclic AMP-responsive element-binding protein 1 [Dermatophagoides pteronyssinus]